MGTSKNKNSTAVAILSIVLFGPVRAGAEGPLTNELPTHGISQQELMEELGIDESALRDVIVELRTSNEGSWGRPGDLVYCPAGSAAAGFQIKFEAQCGDCDDTAANAVEILCRNVRTSAETARIYSTQGPWGYWTGERNCEEGDFIFGFQTRVEPRQGDGDDTALNGMITHCRPYRSDQVQPTSQPRYNGTWGLWSGYEEARCPDNAVVVGLQTFVEPPQGKGTDDTALNAIRLYCLVQ